jgi:hypothetical protein
LLLLLAVCSANGKIWMKHHARLCCCCQKRKRDNYNDDDDKKLLELLSSSSSSSSQWGERKGPKRTRYISAPAPAPAPAVAAAAAVASVVGLRNPLWVSTFDASARLGPFWGVREFLDRPVPADPDYECKLITRHGERCSAATTYRARDLLANDQQLDCRNYCVRHWIQQVFDLNVLTNGLSVSADAKMQPLPIAAVSLDVWKKTLVNAMHPRPWRALATPLQSALTFHMREQKFTAERQVIMVGGFERIWPGQEPITEFIKEVVPEADPPGTLYRKRQIIERADIVLTLLSHPSQPNVFSQPIHQLFFSDNQERPVVGWPRLPHNQWTYNPAQNTLSMRNR